MNVSGIILLRICYICTPRASGDQPEISTATKNSNAIMFADGGMSIAHRSALQKLVPPNMRACY